MKILITGGAGYLGSVITGKMLERGYSVTVLDKLIFNQTSLLQYTSNPNFKFIHGDVRNEKLLEKLCLDSDVIIPLAAIVGFPACASEPELAKEINFTQIFNIVKYTKGLGKKILYPNTNSGYGIGVGQTECTEESPLNPISFYGSTKCEAENFLKSNTDAIMFRLATVFGVSPRMRTDLLVNDLTYRAHTEGYAVIYESHFMRTFIHVKDIAKVFCFAIENQKDMVGEVYNVGSNSMNYSKKDVCETIKKSLPKTYFNYADVDGDPDKRNYIVSYEKINSLGFDTTISLEDGVEELIKSFPLIRIKSNYHNVFQK